MSNEVDRLAEDKLKRIRELVHATDEMSLGVVLDAVIAKLELMKLGEHIATVLEGIDRPC